MAEKHEYKRYWANRRQMFADLKIASGKISRKAEEENWISDKIRSLCDELHPLLTIEIELLEEYIKNMEEPEPEFTKGVGC